MGSCPMSGYPSDNGGGCRGDIVWLECPSKFTYLREGNYYSCSSKFPCKSLLKRDCRLIGYQLVSHRSPRDFEFRYWYLYDRDLDPEGVYKNGMKFPCESVLPSSISRDRESVPYRWFL
jgi:hypothetical protein